MLIIWLLKGIKVIEFLVLFMKAICNQGLKKFIIKNFNINSLADVAIWVD
jgi:hypothetical protein